MKKFIEKNKITLTTLVYFVPNYIAIKFIPEIAYGTLGPIFFIPNIILFSSLNTHYSTKKRLLFNNKILSRIIYFPFFLFNLFVGIIIYIGDNSNKFPAAEIITLLSILPSFLLEQIFFNSKKNKMKYDTIEG